jgi:polyisoprenoid-binding protein YceI
MTESATELKTLLDGGSLAGDYTLDPAQSFVKLATKSMWGLVKVNGSFGELSGNAAIAADGTVTGTLTVAAASVDTGNAKRDTHLKSKDFFHVENHPEITYIVTSVTPADGGGTVAVTGTLTVLGTARPLNFTATATAADGIVTLDAAVPVNRKEHGLTFNQLGMMSLDNTLTIHAVFAKA